MDGRNFRLLNVIDDYNRESVAIEVDTSLPSLRVIRVLERIVAERGKPSTIRTDNGPEFISHKLQQWFEDKGIPLQYIQPGKPTIINTKRKRFQITPSKLDIGLDRC